ncbi:galactose/glucose-binding protein [Brachyspira hampsonii 30446]|uniref:D-galactose/methyl-galactoside binding periplasmic protein MglB n=1 Tax=Brachyspira hampsonii 30446 TaxID=1289135 RepID=A0A2U4F383_9SPIR|nr:galactose ABC transporter substrate-binding protein [Brachyspira hampsonii]EKV56917.1 galactose/glucose-binding protein [Brachyspira hampsonii 30446]MBW5394695.1 galactose glucose-binding protein [Brachyspira hampsonii]OEJ18274.1 galactose glucose-binding protein [Brachyspira hampsonii]
MKRFIILLLTVLLSSSVLLYTQRKINSMGVALYRYDDSYMKYLKQYIEKNINKNTSLIMSDSYNSQSTQNGQIDMFLQKNVSLLAINLVDKTQAQKVLDKISINNKPLIFFNRDPGLEVLKTYDKVWYIGGISEEAGNAQGRVIVESWKDRMNWDKNQDGKIQCVILKGDLNDNDTINKTEYMKKYIASNNIKLNILAEVSANGKRNEAAEVMQNIIYKYGDKIEYIICNNDNMALGALDTLKELGYNSSSRMLNYIPIVGIDGIPECLEEINNYGIFATVMQNPSIQAQALCSVSSNIINGKSPLEGLHFNFYNNKYIVIPYIPVTKYNIDTAIKIYK